MIFNQEIPNVDYIDFAERRTLTFTQDMLKKTANERLANGGMPKSRPVEHWELFQYITQKLEDNVGEIDKSPIYISQNHAKRVNWQGAKGDPVPLNNLLITRAVSLIKTQKETEMMGEKFSATVAISYNERGIEIAIGENVWACSNMNIFGGKRYSTYQAYSNSNRVVYDEMISKVTAEIEGINDNHARNMETVGRLMDVNLSMSRQHELQAKLFEQAVRFGGTNPEVLNVTQNVAFTKELLKRREQAEARGREINAWDFTQAGTEHLKPASNDLVSLYPTIERFNDFVVSETLS